MTFSSVKAVKHRFFCLVRWQERIKAEFAIDFSYLTLLINNRKWAHFSLLSPFQSCFYHQQNNKVHRILHISLLNDIISLQSLG